MMLKWIERILIGLALMGLFFECLGYFQIGNFVVIRALFFLALFYLFFSVFIFTKIEFLNFKLIDKQLATSSRIPISAGIGVLLFFSVITILFRHFLWPGTVLFEIMICGLIVIALIFSTVKYFLGKDFFYVRIIKYLLIYGFVNLIMFSLPRFFWVEIKYRNHPDYIEAYKAKMTHDRDSILDKKAKIEYDKMVQNESK